MDTERIFSEDGRSEKSAGQLMKEVTEDLSTLFRKEIELAKQELSSAVSEKVKGVAIIAVAGVFAFFALIFVLLAVRDGFDVIVPPWAADLITAGLLLAIGGLAVALALRRLRTPIRAELSKRSLKEDVELYKTLGRR